MADSFIPTGTGKKLDSDVIARAIDGNSHNVERQRVVVVQPEDAAQFAYDAEQHVDAFLARASDSSADMNVDGSVTPQLFVYTVAADEQLALDEVVLWLRDAGGFSATTFGALAALTTGLKIEVYDASSTPVLVATLLAAAKDLGDVLRAGATYEGPTALVADCLRARLRTTRGGQPMLLPAGYSIRATVADNLAGLDELRVAIVGRLTS